MMVNDKGLAGSGDYPVASARRGDPTALLPEPAEPQYHGLMGGTILRYIAERASSCAEALAIVQDFVAKGYYAGGKVNGNHLLFVDREGAILEVSYNSRHVASKYHTQKVYFSRLDNSAAARRLRESAEPIDFHLFHNVSRDPSVCFPSSISGMTVEIDPDHPKLFTCAWLALPASAVAFPLLMGQRRTPACLLDGTAYQLGKTTKGGNARWEALEQSMRADKKQLTAEVASAVAVGPTDQTAERLEQWSSTQAQTLIEAMQEPE